jgi:hypothetical protein
MGFAGGSLIDHFEHARPLDPPRHSGSPSQAVRARLARFAALAVQLLLGRQCRHRLGPHGLALVNGCLVGHRRLGGEMTKTSHRFGNGSADVCGRSSGPRGFDAQPTAEPFAHCCASQLRIDDIEQAAIRSMAWQFSAVDQFIRSRGRSRAGRGLRLRVRPGCDPKANEAVPTPRAVIAPMT